MAPLNPPDPPLEDGVIALRGWRTSDAPDITRMFQDREALEWTRAPAPYREGDARQWLPSPPTPKRPRGPPPPPVAGGPAAADAPGRRAAARGARRSRRQPAGVDRAADAGRGASRARLRGG